MMIMMPMMILIRLVEAEKQTTAKKRPGLARNVGRLPFGCSPASDFYYLFHVVMMFVMVVMMMMF